MPGTRASGYPSGMLHLASRSPRRRELLAQFGIPFGVLDVDVPERREPGEPPEMYVSRVAREKAGAGLLAVVGSPGAVVLGADTEVILGDRVYGKPADADDAARMLASLAGRTHRVDTTVWAISAGREQQATSVSDVEFAPMDDMQVADYLATGEWRGKAGGYAIQGRAAAYVSRLAGSHSGVMGLPMHETARLLRAFGLFA